MITPPAGSQTQITCNYMPEDTTKFPGFPGFVQLQEAGAFDEFSMAVKTAPVDLMSSFLVL
jgi:hypothetical protein